MYIISGCLVGENVRYDGSNNLVPAIRRIMGEKNCFICCPEVMAGLGIPRTPAEMLRGKVLTNSGDDLTEEFKAGARLALEGAIHMARELDEDIEGAILKSKSPSCGSGQIYDGTFSDRKIVGDGVFAALLKENNIKVVTEEEYK